MIESDLTVDITEEVIDIEFVAEQGLPGAAVEDSLTSSQTTWSSQKISDALAAILLPVVMSEIDPQIMTPARFGPLLWIQTNASGTSIIDILFIPAA